MSKSPRPVRSPKETSPDDHVTRLSSAIGLESLPREGGAYALVIDLDRPLAVPAGRKEIQSLKPGRYLYAGSAYGPGGIQARVARHARRDKSLRWHVDHLTVAAGVSWAVALPGGKECDIVACLIKDNRVSQPIPGFGSSDCRSCKTHLLALPEGFDTAQLGARLNQAFSF
ncbi:GIY-YIG nuclease family protein [Rhodovibrionaceae bacterium A322]